MVVTVKVTQFDIDHGVRSSVSSCPIAHALHHDYPFARVYGSWVTLDYKHEADLPPEAIQFIDMFDEGATVEPFTFILKV